MSIAAKRNSVSLSPGDFVLDGDPTPSPTKGWRPPFSAHVYCGQVAAWIEMPIGIAVGLGPDDTVLNGDPAAPSLKGVKSPPQFSAHLY